MGLSPTTAPLTMKIKKLIKNLNNLDPDLDVIFLDDDGEIRQIEYIETFKYADKKKKELTAHDSLSDADCVMLWAD